MVASVTSGLLLCLVFAATVATRTADAYSAQLFDGARCLPSNLIGYETDLDSGQCVVLGTSGPRGGSSAQVACQGTTTVTESSLFIGPDCQVVAARLQGASSVGDGKTCLLMSAVDGSGLFSAYIDCSASGAGSSGPSAALVAGAIVGALAGAALLVGGGRWWYRSVQVRRAAQLQHDVMHMAQPPMVHGVEARAGPYVASSRPSNQAAATTIVALALLCVALPSKVAALSDPIDDAMFQFIGYWTWFLVLLVVCVRCLVPGAFR